MNRTINLAACFLLVILLTGFVAAQSLSQKSPTGNEITYNLLFIGDYNEDGKVTFFDLNKLLSNWNTQNPLYDEDGSGVVDKADLNLLLANWGEGRMLRGDIIHSGDTKLTQHCRITNAELALVETHIGSSGETVLSRLSDINNDGTVTQKDLDLMRIQRDLSIEAGFEFSERKDLNCDGVINNKDLSLLKKLWGQKEYQYSVADINEDSKVDIQDLMILLNSI